MDDSLQANDLDGSNRRVVVGYVVGFLVGGCVGGFSRYLVSESISLWFPIATALGYAWTLGSDLHNPHKSQAQSDDQAKKQLLATALGVGFLLLGSEYQIGRGDALIRLDAWGPVFLGINLLALLRGMLFRYVPNKSKRS